ncbi:MAG TPA: type II toxin-antitoxin system VapC family toxin [Candidatus Nanoarchaeia archaeon]|nr:type II toxin-antitoxin system VapC family toxin [Candidatus Nanoarchaeia archaeon]
MNLLIDTSIIVQIDRKDNDTIKAIKKMIEKNHTAIISVVTVSEILTGSYLSRDSKKSVEEAKRILGQFIWLEVTPEIAEKTAQYLAYLIAKGNKIEYQDVVIAATGKIAEVDYILTLNKEHFNAIPDFKEKAYTPKEILKLIK